MRKTVVLALGVLVVVALSAFYFFQQSGPQEREIEGVVVSVSDTEEVITLRTGDGREISLAVMPDTLLINEEGEGIDIKDIRRGFSIRTLARFSGLAAVPSRITITNSPSIVVYTPTSNQAVSQTIYLTGIARVFENNVEYRVKDDKGVVVATGFTTAAAQNIGEFGSFEKAITYRKPTSTQGTLEVFETSADTGEEVNKVVIPIEFLSQKS